MYSDNVAILLKKALLTFDKMANPEFLKYGITAQQYKVVKYLYMHKDDSVRQVDIENYYSLTHPTAIGLLNQLEEKGFVTRKINPDDARSRIVSLTDKSLEMEGQLEAVGAELEARLTVGLTDKEADRLRKLLQKMISGLD